MIPLGAIRYVIKAAIIVVCLFMGLRFIFAHEMRREAWRSNIKHRIYIARQPFKVITILLGYVLLFIALYVAYFQIIGLMDKE